MADHNQLSELMQVSFTSTLDQRVDLQLSLLAHSKEATRWRRFGALGVALFSALVIAYLGLRIWPDRGWETAVVGVLVGTAYAVTYPSTLRKLIRKRTRRLLLEFDDSQEPYAVCVKLQPDVIRTEAPHSNIEFPWASVTTIESGPDSIVIRARSGVVNVPYRALASEDDRQRFLEIAIRLQAAALE